MGGGGGVIKDSCTKIRKTAWYLVPKGSLGILMIRLCIVVLWNS